MPVPCMYLMKSAAAAAEVSVERRHVWPQVHACIGGPHEKAERPFKVLAGASHTR